jgi:hypothetical protein
MDPPVGRRLGPGVLSVEGVPDQWFTACRVLPDAESACDRGRTRRCRSALRPGWRRSSFWSVVRRRSGCTRSPTRVRSAAPAAPAAERGSGCFAVGQADTVPPWSLLLLRPEQHLGGTLRNHGDLIIIRHYRLVAPKNRGLDARTPRLRSTRDASCSGRQVATRAADPLGGSGSNAQAARLANRFSTWCCCYAAPRTWAQACREGGAA